jgi:hypothetical protein
MQAVWPLGFRSGRLVVPRRHSDHVLPPRTTLAKRSPLGEVIQRSPGPRCRDPVVDLHYPPHHLGYGAVACIRADRTVARSRAATSRAEVSGPVPGMGW